MPPRYDSVMAAFDMAEKSFKHDFLFMCLVDQELDLSNILHLHAAMHLTGHINMHTVFPSLAELEEPLPHIPINSYCYRGFDMVEKREWRLVYLPFTFTTAFIVTKDNGVFYATRFNPSSVRLFIIQTAQERDMSTEDFISWALANKLDWNLKTEWHRINKVILASHGIEDALNFYLLQNKDKKKEPSHSEEIVNDDQKLPWWKQGITADNLHQWSMLADLLLNMKKYNGKDGDEQSHA